MYEMRNRKIAAGEHAGNVLEMHLDGLDLLFVVRVVGGDLNEPSLFGQNKMMGGGGLTKTHTRMALASLYHSRMMVAFGLRC